MNANELFMGMKVIFNCIGGFQIIVSVTGFDGVFVYGQSYNQSEQGSHWCRIHDVEPISLTPEILQKNGFELKPDGWIWCKDDGNEEQNYIFIQFRKGCDEVRTVELNFVGKVQGTFRHVQDVHEIQNLFNICRIKKEIEL